MIDIHCHLLPGIDDGPKNLGQALQLAQAAVDNGITYSVVTPHIHPGRFDNSKSIIESRTAEFRDALLSAGIPLAIGIAAEVRLSPEILTMIERGEIPFYGCTDGYRTMLLEFPHSHIPPGSDNLVELLLKRKIKPVIAHPERNKDIIRDLAKLMPFVEMGCILQLTASAVAGMFGEKPFHCARKILEIDALKILATDAHNMHGRAPKLREGRNAVAGILGEQAANDMVFANPQAIIQSQMRDQGQVA